MSAQKPFLVAETPNAGDCGHRFLVSAGAPKDDSELVEYIQRWRESDATVEADLLGVRRAVIQTFSNRPAWEILLLGGITVKIEVEARAKLVRKLRELLETLGSVTEHVDRDVSNGLRIERKELDEWLRELLSIVGLQDQVTRAIELPTSKRKEDLPGKNAEAIDKGNRKQPALSFRDVIAALAGFCLAVAVMVGCLVVFPSWWSHPKPVTTESQSAETTKMKVKEAVAAKNWDCALELAKALPLERQRELILPGINKFAQELVHQKGEEGNGVPPDFENARKKLERDFPRERYAAALGPDFLKETSDSLDEQEDRHLYKNLTEAALADKLDKAKNYLKTQGTKGRMKEHVERLRDYLSNKPCKFQLRVVNINGGVATRDDKMKLTTVISVAKKTNSEDVEKTKALANLESFEKQVKLSITQSQGLNCEPFCNQLPPPNSFQPIDFQATKADRVALDVTIEFMTNNNALLYNSKSTGQLEDWFVQKPMTLPPKNHWFGPKHNDQMIEFVVEPDPSILPNYPN